MRVRRRGETACNLLDVPYDYDASGLRIVANGLAFGVGDLLPGYASYAGFRIGDILVNIDGRRVDGLTLPAGRSSFRIDGRGHAVTLERRGVSQMITYQAPANLR